MAKYRYDMSQENEKMGLELPDGWYNFEVVKMEITQSKAGNEMFKITLALDSDPSQGCEVYAITQQGKRWFLKSLLQACQCPAGADGVYEFDIDDIVGKIVAGKVVNAEETFINREGNEQKIKKSKVISFKERINLGDKQ